MRVIPLQPPPGRRRQWSVVTLLVAGVIGVLFLRAFTDAPPTETPRDLEPPEPEGDPNWRDTAGTNGWALIQIALTDDAAGGADALRASRAAALAARSGWPGDESVVLARKFRAIRENREPWDDAVVEKHRRGGVMTERVEEALARPEFRPAASPPFTGYWSLTETRLEADFAHALHTGDTDRARRCVSGLTRLSALILRETRSGADYDLAEGMRRTAARMTFDLLAAAPANRAVADALAAEWDAEAPEAEAGVRKLVGATLERLAGGDFAGHRVSAMISNGLRNRPHRTRRLGIAEARRIRDTGFPAVPTLEESPGARARAAHSAPFPWLLALDSNRRGLLDMMPHWAEWAAVEEGVTIRGNLFRTHAMRTALALWRWRLDHGGALPATLEELTPAYLKTAQEDQWTGGPLAWDPGSGTISATGADWEPRPAHRGATPGYIAPEGTRPWVRLPEIPRPPAGPPPSP